MSMDSEATLATSAIRRRISGPPSELPPGIETFGRRHAVATFIFLDIMRANFEDGDGGASKQCEYFRPRPLENLALADEIESLHPILDSKVLNILPNSDTPQIFAACGRGSRSSLRTLRHGLEVEESVSSDLPGIPNAVWTTKTREDSRSIHEFEASIPLIGLNLDAYDSYIILSFVNGTLVLSISETIEELQDTGFLSSARTLAVQQIGTDALLQVHPEGIRHVLANGHVTEWKAPSGKSIVNATTNKRQVVGCTQLARIGVL
ncbi:mono-functional DNA-alkylating methyl methanesulfonate N-term-domain-containing protein [Lentinula detonsa]|uniref:Mono-functional DNA-alkylating methyl methanesulfonate N-term-domain-containing protein n=1 Tax=Lentinula detonsa TaxID=2804962 RepID=A0AA38UN25_9AGAR|nr:mono-functional DNA-alkylating methyl methanesulfonate N-term-domain-containing protein [Lentinula detonsa]